MSWRFIFTRNRWQKALAIFLATMIWLTVRSGSMEGVGEGLDDELEIRVPVAVLASPSDTGTYQLSPSMVTVTLQMGTKSAEHRPQNRKRCDRRRAAEAKGFGEGFAQGFEEGKKAAEATAFEEGSQASKAEVAALNLHD
jgi:hypothetical protein